MISVVPSRRIAIAAFMFLVLCVAHSQPAAEPGTLPSIFATITVDREHIYAGEVFYVVLSISSTNPNLSDEFQLTGLSDHPEIEFEAFGELAPATLEHAGVTYEVQRFKCRAVAKEATTTSISPKLGGAVITTIKRDFFFGIQRVRTQVAIPIAPVKLVIHPLPDSGKPEDYSGLIGQISYEVSVSDQDVAVGDLVRMMTTISGDAILKDAKAPKLSAVPGLRVYDPKLLPDQSKANRRVFEQVVVPLSTDVNELTPISFSYFDPRAKAYRTVTRGPFKLSVKKQAAGRPHPNQPPEHLPTSPGLDIRGLKTSPADWNPIAGRPWYATTVFLGSQLVPPVILIILLFSARYSKQFESRNTLKQNRATALAHSRDLLEKAKVSLDGGDVPSCVETIWRAASDFFCDRLELSPGEFATGTLMSRVTDAGLTAESADKLRGALELCERLRFSGAAERSATDDQQRDLSVALEDVAAAIDICGKRC